MNELNEVLEKIKPLLTHELKDELIEVLDTITEDEWFSYKRSEHLEKIWLQVKQKKIDSYFEQMRSLRRGLSDSNLIKMLSDISGFTSGEMKDIYIRLGDIGSVAEFVLTHKKQNDLDCFND